MTLSISPSAVRKMAYTTPAEEQALNDLLTGEHRAAHVDVTGDQVEAVLQQVHAPHKETPSAVKLLGAIGNALDPVSYAEIVERIDLALENAPGADISGNLVAAAMSKREGL